MTCSSSHRALGIGLGLGLGAALFALYRAKKETRRLSAQLPKTSSFGGRVTRVVLTGGPCGGKSSALDSIKEHFTKKGFNVLCIPETPTILFNGGCVYPGTSDLERLLAFEEYVMRMQGAAEVSFAGIGESTGKKTIIVHDRGLMDIKAYVTPDVWSALLRRFAINEQDLYDRYDIVLHLVTAADGAAEFYTTENNQTRTETPAQAIATDKRVESAWATHPEFSRIENKTKSFKDKLAACISAIESRV